MPKHACSFCEAVLDHVSRGLKPYLTMSSWCQAVLDRDFLGIQPTKLSGPTKLNHVYLVSRPASQRLFLLTSRAWPSLLGVQARLIMSFPGIQLRLVTSFWVSSNTRALP